MDMKIVATAILGFGILLGVSLLTWMAKKGWINLPSDPNAVKLLAVCLMLAVLPVFATISEGGVTIVICWGVIVLVGLVSFLVGFSYYKQRQGKSDIQKIDLNE